MKKIQFVSDKLVEQIMEGRKTASVACIGEINITEDEYNDALVVGEFYEVYDSNLKPSCIIRITAMELCRWDNIPERLWQGETNLSAEEFKDDHIDYFDNPSDCFEFVAYYFELVK
ncbi:ASCH domain-containing protein [Candidatus Zixiibacteriota bacterium]